MLRRLSNFLHGNQNPREGSAPVAADPDADFVQTEARRNHAAYSRLRDRNRNAALRSAQQERPARAESPYPDVIQQHLQEIVRIEIDALLARQPAAVEERAEIEAPVDQAAADASARLAGLYGLHFARPRPVVELEPLPAAAEPPPAVAALEPQLAAAVPEPRPAVAVPEPQLAAAAPEPRPAAAAAEPLPVIPAPAPQAPEPFDLKLSDLRMQRDETDHNLVFAYPIPPGVYEPVALAVDAASAGLEGRAYLEFLQSDPRTGVGMMVLLESKILRSVDPLPEERITEIAARLRPVMAEGYLSANLRGEIDIIAQDALPHCHDRTDVAIAHMDDAALHARLIRGAVTDETTLYNYGVSFFMLNAVKEETDQYLKERREAGVIPRQEVHDHQNARYYLQNKLHLPHRMQRPIALSARDVLVNRRVAEDVILPRVTARAIEHNGQNVMRFVSNWAPWRRHLDEGWPAMQGMSASFHKSVTTTMERRDVPNSDIANMTEVEYQEKIRQIQTDKVRAEDELADQLALELLFNRRGEFLVENNRLTAYFN